MTHAPCKNGWKMERNSIIQYSAIGYDTSIREGLMSKNEAKRKFKWSKGYELNTSMKDVQTTVRIPNLANECKWNHPKLKYFVSGMVEAYDHAGSEAVRGSWMLETIPFKCCP